jgi:hypothetical protein
MRLAPRFAAPSSLRLAAHRDAALSWLRDDPANEDELDAWLIEVRRAML